MRRRQFLQATALTTTLTALGRTTHAKHFRVPNPAGIGNPLVSLGKGVFAEPKYPTEAKSHESKVPGTMVSLTVAPIVGLTKYLVTVFPQYRSNENDTWKYAACARAFRTWYEWEGMLRDIYTVSEEGQKVSLFIPDAAHRLPIGNEIELRQVILFWTTDSQQIAGVNPITLPPERVTPQRPRDFVAFGRGDEDPPYEVYDISANNSRLIPRES